jgi:anti-anti-sigma factor
MWDRQDHSLAPKKPGNDATVIRFTGGNLALTEENVAGLEVMLADLTAARGPRHLVLDFGNVNFVSSTGLDMLIRLHLRLRDSGGSLALRAVHEKVFEVFEVAHLIDLFEIRRFPTPAGPAGTGQRPMPSTN